MIKTDAIFNLNYRTLRHGIKSVRIVLPGNFDLLQKFWCMEKLFCQSLESKITSKIQLHNRNVSKKSQKDNCDGRESNPDQLLGRQLC
jgi:hypothetical protein